MTLASNSFKFDNLTLIEGQVSAHGKPVLPVGADFEIEVIQGYLVGYGQFFPFRPLDNHFIPNILEFHQGLKAIVRIVEMPFPVVFLLHVDGQIEYRTEFFDVPGLFFL